MANKIRQSNLDASVVTGHTELSETVNINDVFLVYDQNAGTLKKVTRANILGAPSVSSISPTNVTTGDGTGNVTFTITGTDFLAGATAQLLTSGGTPVNFDTVTRDSSTQITGVIAKSSLSNANEPYGVRVDNGNGVTSDLTSQVNIDAQPIFTTAAGTLGAFGEGTSQTVYVNATDPESAGNVTFELQSGSLPPGMSLTNTAADGGTAVISGTLPSPGSTTNYNFILRAVDAASNTSSRSFTLTTIAPTSESFTSSGTFSVPSYVTEVDVLVVAGGGSGGSTVGSGGGAGGLIFFPCYPVTSSGTITVTVGCGGPASNTAGQDSVFGSPSDPGLSPTGEVLTAQGGGARGFTDPAASGAGGSGAGIAMGAEAGQPSPGTQPTAPGDSGAYGFGNPGGTATGNGGAGGGGAGSGGSPAPGQNGGPGGNGRAYTISDGTTPVYYAGGGAGGSRQSGGIGSGGQGGGGNGGNPGNAGQSAQGNKGGGGGGTGHIPVLGSGDGGKGIVIVRY